MSMLINNTQKSLKNRKVKLNSYGKRLDTAGTLLHRFMWRLQCGDYVCETVTSNESRKIVEKFAKENIIILQFAFCSF